MSDVVLVAVFGVVTTIVAGLIAPVVLTVFTSKQARADKRMDWRRQDEVAERAAAVAQANLDANRQQLRRLEDVAATVEVTHALVNSDKTAGMQRELAAAKRTRILLKEVVDLKRADGGEPSGETLAELEALESEITVLAVAINDRLRQQKAAEDAVAQERMGHTAARAQQDAADTQTEAAQLQSDAADKQIEVAKGQAAVAVEQAAAADAQARAAEPQIDR